VRIEVELKSIGLALVGWGVPWVSGADVAAFRRPIRGEDGIRYELMVPGSSFKGALRSAAHRMAEVYGFRSCGGRECAGDDPCVVCELFGTPGGSTPSILRVSDFKPKNKVYTFTLRRIRMEDSLMRVAEGGLFAEEYLPPGSEFSGILELVDGRADRPHGEILLLSLAELRLGRLGRHSLFDIRIREDEGFRRLISGSRYAELLEDLRRWLWDEVL